MWCTSYYPSACSLHTHGVLATALCAVCTPTAVHCIPMGIQGCSSSVSRYPPSCSKDEIPHCALVITMYMYAAVVLVDGEVLATIHL